jgi:hypothetical protein
MILVFDLGGPLLAYSLLHSAGMSSVGALILSGIFPAVGILIGALVDRRLDIVGVVVLAGLVVGTIAGLVSNNARLYLVEGAVPSLVFALACLGSLRSTKPLIYRFAADKLDPVRRTLIVTNDFPPRQGGIQSFVHALATRLPEGHGDGVRPGLGRRGGVRRPQPFPVIRHPTSLMLPVPGVARRAAAIAREHGCDAVLFGAAAPLGLITPRCAGPA